MAGAQALIVQGKVDEAIALLKELAQKHPQTPGIEAKLGKAYCDKGNYERAVIHLEQALEQDPDDGESTGLLGFAYYTLGRWHEAIPLLEKIQYWLPPSEITGSYLLGIAYLRTYQYEKARAALARAFSVSPESPQAHLILGQMMLPLELEDKATSEFKHALSIDPRLPMAHFFLGNIYLSKLQVQLALEEFKKERELNPSLWLVYWRIGDAYVRLENWNDAEGALRLALWLYPGFTGPYILLGKVELKRGNAVSAVQYLETAVKMDPKDYTAHYLLGTAYKRLGREEEASREFELAETVRQDKDP